MKAETIDFKFGANGYELTLDGKTIGVVHELEHAEMIATICDRNAIELLEAENKRLREKTEEFEKLEIKLEDSVQVVAAYRMSLKKIQDLSSITKMEPTNGHTK